MKNTKRFVCMLLVLCMVLTMIPAAVAAGNLPFTDVGILDWFYDSVEYVYKNDLMSGTSETTFAPNATTTRGMIVTILHRMENEPIGYGEDFTDVQAGAYYADAVAWASALDIVTGYGDGRFGPNDPITREQMAVILYRYAEYDNQNTVARGDVDDFVDGDKVGSYAEEAMNWAIGKGLISGVGGNRLNPTGTATRAEVATILERFCDEGGVEILIPGLIRDDDDDDRDDEEEDEEVYTVTFDSNGGSDVEPQEVEEGECAEEPEDPTKDGFEFAGWYSDIDLTELYDFDTEVEEDITLYAAWEENRIVPTEIAELFGFDPEEYDSDGDGLSNYDELYLVGTDPTVIDTDEDGISDADDDADEDLLSNIYEIELGTDPLKTDSDFDGLSDYEEVNDYGTDPCNADSDEDGLCDGDETILGLDPLRQKTDGRTLDSERVFTQQLDDSNIAESLREEENDAIPSLTVTGSGNINRKVSVQETESTAFSDSRAIVGEAIDINGDSFDEGVLSFNVSNVDVPYITTEDTEEMFPAIVVCKYGDDGELQYLETGYEEGVLSAQIDGTGTYFVLNVKNLFDELGLALPTVSDVSMLSDPEPLMLMITDAEEDEEQDNANGEAAISLFAFEDKTDTDTVVASADTVKLTKASSGVRAQADVVFIVDTTGSMGDEIYNVKNNISYFVDALNDKGISAALALIDYEDIEADGYDSTRVHKNGSSNWFYSVDDYKKAISNLSLGWGGDTPECAVDALETARLLDMRASAGKIFVLVTDANYKVDNRYGIPSMAAEIELLKNAGVNCSVVSPSTEQGTYYDLYTDTNGVWANIYGNFYEELMELADKIGSDIVGDGYWIYLDGPVPVPVRLDAMPEEGSTVDTDDDGIADIDELEGYEPSKYIDLDDLVTKISHGVITGTNYGLVMMYEYTSNPVEEDSDYDGIVDKNDSSPKSNTFKGILYYDENKKECNVEFTVDYSKFFKDNTTYSKDLSVLSALYASDIYSGIHIKVTEGAVGGADDQVSFGRLFGLQEVEDIHITAAEYAVDKDDLTEFSVGHIPVEYGGEKKEVIILSVRGTNKTNSEWSSNFDVGADTSEYYAAKGLNHPDWINKENHKGFDVAANRVIAKFNDYLVRKGLDDGSVDKAILVTGHSRGAAIANLLGAYFEDRADFKSYTYTFAAPYCTTDNNANSYRTIFNVVNSDDLIPFLPLSDWGFAKYGTVKTVSVADKYEDSSPWGDKTGTFEWLIGRDYNNNGGVASALTAFSKLANSRDDLYVLDTSDDGKVNIGNKYHTTLEGAEERLDEVEDILENAKLLPFCELSIQTSVGVKHVEVTYSPAYLMQNLANMASESGPKTGYDTKGAYATAKARFAVCYIGGMSDPHMQPTYYLIAHNNFATLK